MIACFSIDDVYSVFKLFIELVLATLKLYIKLFSVTFCPSNIYGPDDHFDTEKSHFVPALISKLVKAEDGETIELWGTGNPKRQQLYVDDLAEIIPILLEKHNSGIPLIVAPNENLSIMEMADIANNKIKRNKN